MSTHHYRETRESPIGTAALGVGWNRNLVFTLAVECMGQGEDLMQGTYREVKTHRHRRTLEKNIF